jgi:hypothetical protein
MEADVFMKLRGFDGFRSTDQPTSKAVLQRRLANPCDPAPPTGMPAMERRPLLLELGCRL